MTKIASEIREKTGESVVVRVEPEQPEDRQEILKGIIKDLHKGKDVSVLRRRFHDLIKDVSPAEIAQMEQGLIAEGMPEQEVKQLCGLHVEVFKESLDKKPLPGLPAGHPAHTLMLENRSAEKIIREMEETSEPDRLRDLLERLSGIDRHYLRKENQLSRYSKQRAVRAFQGDVGPP